MTAPLDRSIETRRARLALLRETIEAERDAELRIVLIVLAVIWAGTLIALVFNDWSRLGVALGLPS